MTRFREKAQAKTKQIVGQMVGDNRLVEEGQEQERKAQAVHEEEHDEKQKPSTDRDDLSSERH
jgi:uncharacterized protein YjbJ (UPF0337 family)